MSMARHEDEFNSLHQEIAREGFAVRRQLSADAACELAAALGEIIDETEVRVRPRASTYLSAPAPIPYHTDHPAARYIAWRCNTPDAYGGQNQLLDGSRAVDAMPPGLQDRLSTVRLDCPAITSTVPGSGTPVPIWNPTSRQIFYAPWLLGDVINKPEVIALNSNLQQGLPWHFEILLGEGDVLIVNNHRMLHGRAAIDSGSKRCLTRYWVA